MHLLAQQLIHLQFLLNYAFQFLDVGVDIIIHESNALDGGYEFALLCEQFGVLFDGGHVCGEDFLLFFEHAGHFLLECEVLLFVVPAHRALHCVDVLTNFFLVLVAYYVLYLYLLLDFLGLLHRGHLWSWSCFFDGIRAIFILV